ncbi:MAG TPA: dTDP-4-dehydrorhamnose 3,5-epimerase [Solirubrobacteraceae bacterium]|nr:dTDP-4-dehydrorhamnose 3,5-epimerase [Solirubrobacteraceae bacterium]
MRISPTRLDGPRLIEPTVHGDERGFFVESFRADVLAEAGVGVQFVQDNHSRSRHGIARGMHFQPGQWKLVRCARGAIFDVIVDIRPQSADFGRWEGFTLDDETHRQLLVPDGFAHGFCVLSPAADVAYKVSTYYDPETEAGFRFDDPEVNITWPLDAAALQVSARDRTAPGLSEIAPTLPSRAVVAH